MYETHTALKGLDIGGLCIGLVQDSILLCVYALILREYQKQSTFVSVQLLTAPQRSESRTVTPVSGTRRNSKDSSSSADSKDGNESDAEAAPASAAGVHAVVVRDFPALPAVAAAKVTQLPGGLSQPPAPRQGESKSKSELYRVMYLCALVFCIVRLSTAFVYLPLWVWPNRVSNLDFGFSVAYNLIWSICSSCFLAVPFMFLYW